MPHLAVELGVLLALWVGLWVAALLLSRFLPEGAVRSAISLLPSTLTMFRRLIRSKSVPRRARLILLLGFLYAVSPVTIIPDFVLLSASSTTSWHLSWRCGGRRR